MPVLRDRLRNVEANQQQIQERVAKETIRPSESETEAVQRIAQKASRTFRDTIAKEGLTERVKEQIRGAIAKDAQTESDDYEQQKRIEHIAVATVTGLGPIDPFMSDPSVTEIIVQRYDNICIERNGIIHPVDAAFADEQQLQTAIARIVQPVGRQINISSPIVDARLPNGSRVHATIPPVTPDGATLSIRKFSEEAFTGEDYLRLGSLNEEMLTFLSLCVTGKVSMIVSGGTSTGKTTLLNMLSGYIPKHELIITIEDSCELRLNQPNVRRMETRPTTAEGMMKIDTQMLVKSALRMRPDRIIVGEIRDGTVVDMMSAMCTGHEGSLSTVHANSPNNLVNTRLPILYSMNNNVEFSTESQNLQISEALMLIVQISRMPDGSRKITQVTHVNGLLKTGRVNLHDVFRYDETSGRFEATGYVPTSVVKQAKRNGVDIDPSLFRKEPES